MVKSQSTVASSRVYIFFKKLLFFFKAHFMIWKRILTVFCVVVVVVLNIYLFIYLWLCWVLVSVRGLSPVVANGGHSSSRCAGLSLSRPLLLRSTGSRRAGSVIVAHGPSRSTACGILPDQDSNPCPLHWQADSQPLRHQGSPIFCVFIFNCGACVSEKPVFKKRDYNTRRLLNRY